MERCRYAGDFCATLYTAAKPDGAYGPGHSSLVVESKQGMIVLDLVDDAIRCLEVPYRRDIPRELFTVRP